MSKLIAWVCKWILSISLLLDAAEPNIYGVYYIISCRQETVWERQTWGGERVEDVNTVNQSSPCSGKLYWFGFMISYYIIIGVSFWWNNIQIRIPDTSVGSWIRKWCCIHSPINTWPFPFLASFSLLSLQAHVLGYDPLLKLSSPFSLELLGQCGCVLSWRVLLLSGVLQRLKGKQ